MTASPTGASAVAIPVATERTELEMESSVATLKEIEPPMDPSSNQEWIVNQIKELSGTLLLTWNL